MNPKGKLSMANTQCPNCGAYKTSTRKIMQQRYDQKHYESTLVNGKPAGSLKRNVFTSILVSIVIAVIGGLAMIVYHNVSSWEGQQIAFGLFFVPLTPIIVISRFISHWKRLDRETGLVNTVNKTALYCDICGYNGYLPDFYQGGVVRPGLIAAGEAKNAEDRKRQDAYFMAIEHQKRQNREGK